MKRIAETLISPFIFASSGAGQVVVQQAVQSSQIKITRSGSQPPNKGSAEYFTGSVQVQPLFPAIDPSRTSGGKVTFEPGARSAWHTHPFGQILIVTEGTGWIQQWGGPIEEIREGDVIWIPPGVKHWHGATANTAMTHIAIQNEINSKAVDWMEKVSDEQYRIGRTKSMQIANDLTTVAPALEKYGQGPLAELWKRPGLTPRDRSIVTVATLIARNQTMEMPYYFDLALNNGVKPSELSEIITHLGFYCGWPNATSAVAMAKDIFQRRGIGPDQLPPASPELLPLNEAAEADRAARVEQDFGQVAPGVVQYTTDLLFRDLWLRPALSPRDRSLVTVSALIASGQVAQITYHLNRAMDNGLAKSQASEVLTQLAFYAGWPNVFSALPVAKAVFEKRRD
jgi:4-carboxymuconolactone decarboxylase